MVSYNCIRKMIKSVENILKSICYKFTTFSFDGTSIEHSTETIDDYKYKSVSLISIRKIRLRIFNQIGLKYLKRVSSYYFPARKNFLHYSSMYTMCRILSQELRNLCRETWRALYFLIQLL